MSTPSSIATLRQALDTAAVGEEMYRLCTELYPICRSITGDGVRETLAKIGEHIPLDAREVPSGTAVFDWTVPKEWNIRDAYIKDASGKRVVDFKAHNLHVLNYSTPIHETMPLSVLQDHLFTAPEAPDKIPYRTSYFKETWGFCLTQNQRDALTESDYEVCIDSTLEDGHLVYGECYLPGAEEREIFFSSHVCHPSLANDNMSGLSLAAALAQHLSGVERRYSYRFVFAPGTIGAITWLAQNEAAAARIEHGLILACVGNQNEATYKQSRRGCLVDRAAEHVLRRRSHDYAIQPFSPYGYDERQYCSPGFDLPLGCFMKSAPGTFPEYHTSADNLDLVAPEFLGDSFAKCLDIVEVLEGDGRYMNLEPKCEPMLGKRGLYGALGGTERKETELAMLWVLNFSDGTRSLLEIAEAADMPFATVKEAADLLLAHDLLKRVNE
jgi:aminopeptidase-like protein